MTEDGKLSNDERVSILDRLYDALLRCLLKLLESDTPPKASVLAVARDVLRDNGIRAITRSELRRGLQTMGDLTALPFDDKGNKP